MRRPLSRCNSKIRKAFLPQATTIPLLSADKTSPTLPDFSANSAFQIFSKWGFGSAGKNVNAPGHGVNARSRFRIFSAGSFQFIFPSSFFIFAA